MKYVLLRAVPIELFCEGLKVQDPFYRLAYWQEGPFEKKQFAWGLSHLARPTYMAWQIKPTFTIKTLIETEITRDPNGDTWYWSESYTSSRKEVVQGLKELKIWEM